MPLPRLRHPPVFILAVSLLASSCDVIPQRTPEPSPRSGGRVAVGVRADARFANPILAGRDAVAQTLPALLFESLVAPEPRTGRAVPRLAEMFGVSADGLTLSFSLRPDLVWSDGSALTPDDFVFTAEAVLRSTRAPLRAAFEQITGAAEYRNGRAERIAGIAVSGRAITVRLQRAWCPGLLQIGGLQLVPRSIFGGYLDPKNPGRNLDDAPENDAPPLSSGPFRFVSRATDKVTLARNDRYFLGPALLDELVLRAPLGSSDPVEALRSGEVDLVAVEPSERDRAVAAGFAINRYLSPSYTFIAWNQLRGGREFLGSVVVRQAFAHAIDVDGVIARALLGEGQRVRTHTLPSVWTYDAGSAIEHRYDPTLAASMLETDGWRKGTDGVYAKDGRRLSLTIVTNRGNVTRETFARAAVEQLQRIGVDASVELESFEALSERLLRSKDGVHGGRGGRDFDAAVVGWSIGPDPDGYAVWHSSQVENGSNLVGYRDEIVDRALEEGRSRCADADRALAYRTIDRRLSEQQPYLFGFGGNILIASAPRLRGVSPATFAGPLANVERWWVTH